MILNVVGRQKHFKKFFNNHYREFLIAVGCILLASVAAFFYWQNHNHTNQMAQMAFSQTIEEMRKSEQNPELWASTELTAKTGFSSYKNSSYGPYFLAIQAQAALKQNNYEQGLELLKQAVDLISSKSPLYNLYKTKLALLKLDADDVSIQTSGFNELQQLSQDLNNKNRDEALYYLGEYYYNQNDEVKAKEVWKELLSEFQGSENTAMSPWAYLVLQKFRQ